MPIYAYRCTACGHAKDVLQKIADPVLTTCPACGAPLPAEMVDKCRHCGALVESSAFDWVLSRIEQDEVYAG